MTCRLEVSDLCGGYGDTPVVNRVSFCLGAGEVLGVLGRNGAGKTTLARLVTGALPSARGTILLNGESLTHEPAHRRREHGLGYLPQVQVVFETLSVHQNLVIAEQRISPELYYDVFPRLAEKQSQIAGTLSGGERKILGFVRAMLEETAAIVLDEPSEGVQPENIERMAWCIRERAEAGVSVVLCEQNIGFLHRVSDHCLCLETGSVILRESVREVSESQLRSLVAL